ncbi:kelch repeat and BTB domain-containing protein 2-like [Amphiura filiformis]|uniref:kelch repeat and BTB domain-containing protein 2-like n=1 Tax=Amphiura filiformis TaxID=82378 RepID=UPI003B21379E
MMDFDTLIRVVIESGETSSTSDSTSSNASSTSTEELPVDKDTFDFHHMFLDKATSDITLVVGGNEFPAHRAILAGSSAYFKNMLYGEWQEAKQHHITLEETPACAEVFEAYLRYYYDRKVFINSTTVASMSILADKHGVLGLKTRCLKYVDKLLGQFCIPGALDWLCYGEQLDDALSQRCYDIISFHLQKASACPSWLYLTQQQLAKILERSDVVANDELTVYKATESWILSESQLPHIKENIDCLLPLIRFKNIPAPKLALVEQSQLANHPFAKNILRESVLCAFRYRALIAESPPSSLSSSSVPPQEIRQYEIQLKPSIKGARGVPQDRFVIHPILSCSNPHIKSKLIKMTWHFDISHTEGADVYIDGLPHATELSLCTGGVNAVKQNRIEAYVYGHFVLKNKAGNVLASLLCSGKQQLAVTRDCLTVVLFQDRQMQVFPNVHMLLYRIQIDFIDKLYKSPQVPGFRRSSSPVFGPSARPPLR